MNKHRRRVSERREKSNQHAHLTIISRKTTSKQNMNKKKTSTCVIFLKNRTRRRQMTNLTSIKRHGENQLILMLTWNRDKWSYKMRCFSKKRLVICLILVEREREGRRERLDSINYANRLSSLSLSFHLLLRGRRRCSVLFSLVEQTNRLQEEEEEEEGEGKGRKSSVDDLWRKQVSNKKCALSSLSQLLSKHAHDVDAFLVRKFQLNYT